MLILFSHLTGSISAKPRFMPSPSSSFLSSLTFPLPPSFPPDNPGDSLSLAQMCSVAIPPHQGQDQPLPPPSPSPSSPSAPPSECRQQFGPNVQRDDTHHQGHDRGSSPLPHLPPPPPSPPPSFPPQNAGNSSALTCSVTIPITKDMTGPIYVYYEIHGLYQNHRRWGGGGLSGVGGEALSEPSTVGGKRLSGVGGWPARLRHGGGGRG